MKKIIIALAILGMSIQAATAQEVYKEVLRIATEAAENESNDMQVRLTNTFIYDALKYMAGKTAEVNPDASVSVLDYQALALYEFITDFVARTTMATRADERKIVLNRFYNASLSNPRFNDLDKQLVEAYINEKYITQFSLDTDWEKALAEIRKVYK